MKQPQNNWLDTRTQVIETNTATRKHPQIIQVVPSPIYPVWYLRDLIDIKIVSEEVANTVEKVHHRQQAVITTPTG